MPVKDRVALITGGAMGLGQVLCQRFAREGARIGFCDLSESLLEETTQKVKEAGGECFPMVCDVSDENQVDRWIGATTEHFGRIDILVNNAAILHEPGESGPVHTHSVEAFDRLMAVNVRGVFLCMRRAVPEMLKVGAGRIINIGSVDGLRPLPGIVAYNTSKNASHYMTLSAAQDLARSNITVNCIAPGGFWSPMIVKHTTQERYEGGLERVPIPRKASEIMQQVAMTAVFLAGDEADYITAQVITVDGGYFHLGIRQR